MPEFPSGGVRTTAVSLTSATEIVVAIIPGSGNLGPVVIGQEPPSSGQLANIVIRGAANITPGATGSAANTIKCYRNNGGAQTVGSAKSDSPTQVGIAAGQVFSTVASDPLTVPFEFQDLANPAEAVGYIVTITEAGSTGTLNELVCSGNDFT
jgi:hypothetical protein